VPGPIDWQADADLGFGEVLHVDAAVTRAIARPPFEHHRLESSDALGLRLGEVVLLGEVPVEAVELVARARTVERRLDVQDVLPRPFDDREHVPLLGEEALAARHRVVLGEDRVAGGLLVAATGRGEARSLQVRRRRDAEELEQRRIEVERLDRLLHDEPGRHEPWRDDDQRDVQQLVPERVGVAGPAVLEELLAVVGRHDQDPLLERLGLPQRLE